ncbi:MAG: Ribonuclease [Clostridia bacterium]|nr:Ribonuclease [Clostridia bacterium]
MNKKEITIYTDGACSGNPGPGGYGTVLIYNGTRKELSGGFKNTTNNRMEITAVIKGLEALKQPCKVTVYSDSKYVVDAIEKGWLNNWIKNNWRKSNKEKVLNVNLWQRLLELMAIHDVSFRWVKGHHENEENNRCDQLAVLASKQSELPEDIRE